MKSLHKVTKRVLRYEIGVFLKNSDFEYLYGSISYLFGYEKNRCFFLMEMTRTTTTRLIRGGELEGPGVWQTLGKKKKGGGRKKDWSLANSGKKKSMYIHTHTHLWWYIQVCTMGRRPRVWQALGRDSGWMEGKFRAKFFVTCPDGSERV
jgi:hypothetical protein